MPITIRLTEDELLQRVRLTRCMEPPAESDTVIIREDAPVADLWLKATLRMRYEKMMTADDPSALPLTDCTATATVEASPGDRTRCELYLPPSAVRAVSVRLRGWLADAKIVPPDSEEAADQTSEYGRAGRCRPIAVDHGDGHLTLYGGFDGATPTAERITAVALPPEGEYLLTPAMLHSLAGCEC